MHCFHCNAIIPAAKFCPECGKELRTGLTVHQKSYLEDSKKKHTVNAVVRGTVGGVGISGGLLAFAFGIFAIFGGLMIALFGLILCLTLIGAIIGIPIMVTGMGVIAGGAAAVGIGGASTIVGGAATGAAMQSAKKRGEAEDKLHGV